MLKRLDKYLGNAYWYDCYPETVVKHLDFWCSNHRPILVSFKGMGGGERYGKKKRSSRFYFEHIWSQDLDYGEVISSNWNNLKAGTIMYGFLENLTRCGNLLVC